MEEKMNQKTIGILGASGYVGIEAVKTILTFTDHNVILGGRNQEKIRKVFPDLGSRGECLQVDLYNRKLLQNFCNNCDIVVNCAGPSKQILNKIASVAVEQGIHYVDVSGDDHLYKILAEKQKDIEDKNLTFIISAGLYPGLSEIFPAYIAENYFDNIDSLELFYAGKGKLSFNAAYDFVCSIEEGYGEGMTYYKNGKPKKITGGFHRKYALPHPASEFDAYPLLTPEFKRIAERYRIKSACFYNAFQDKSILNTIIKIQVLEQYKTEAQKRESANLLKEQFNEHTKKTDDFSMFHLIADGSKNGKYIQLVSNLLYKNGGNVLSGIIVANTARLILEGSSNGFGCFFLPEGVNVTRLMDVLSEQDIYPKHTFTDLNETKSISATL